MSLEGIVTELNTLSTDAARDVVIAAQLILKGKQSEVRNLCNPWGVQLKVQKRYRPMETIKQELKMALTKRAMILKSETEASAGGAATEHAEDSLEESCMCKPGFADAKSQRRCLRRWSSKSLKPRKPPHAWPIWNRRGSRLEENTLLLAWSRRPCRVPQLADRAIAVCLGSAEEHM